MAMKSDKVTSPVRKSLAQVASRDRTITASSPIELQARLDAMGKSHRIKGSLRIELPAGHELQTYDIKAKLRVHGRVFIAGEGTVAFKDLCAGASVMAPNAHLAGGITTASFFLARSASLAFLHAGRSIIVRRKLRVRGTCRVGGPVQVGELHCGSLDAPHGELLSAGDVMIYGSACISGPIRTVALEGSSANLIVHGTLNAAWIEAAGRVDIARHLECHGSRDGISLRSGRSISVGKAIQAPGDIDASLFIRAEEINSPGAVSAGRQARRHSDRKIETRVKPQIIMHGDWADLESRLVYANRAFRERAIQQQEVADRDAMLRDTSRRLVLSHHFSIEPSGATGLKATLAPEEMVAEKTTQLA